MSPAQPPTQSSAAQVTPGPTRWTPASRRSEVSARSAEGSHTAATRSGSSPVPPPDPVPAPPTGPGKIRRPSPGARSGPQEKQRGNGCETSPGKRSDAARAWSGSTASTGLSSVSLTRARATGSPSRRSQVSVPSCSTGIARSSGGGDIRVTSTVACSPASRTRSASVPAVKPPLPEADGPQKRAGMVSCVCGAAVRAPSTSASFT